LQNLVIGLKKYIPSLTIPFSHQVEQIIRKISLIVWSRDKGRDNYLFRTVNHP